MNITSRLTRFPGHLMHLSGLLVLLVAFLWAMPSFAASRTVVARANPVYPEIAKRMKISGAVKVSATVDASGKVTAVKTVEGNRMLASAAEEAVRKWKFEGGAGETTETVTLNFAMAQ